jgi:antitoxin component YwqK of YwqJK toxin-antitoxin module
MLRRFQFSLRAICALVALATVAMWYFSGYMPGTLYMDQTGTAHGTGTKRFFYPSGTLKLEDRYVAGRLSRSRWYRPDGSLLAETKWSAGPCVGYDLRDDGSVRVECEFVQGMAHGKATFYDKTGHVERTAVFREGVEVKP